MEVTRNEEQEQENDAGVARHGLADSENRPGDGSYRACAGQPWGRLGIAVMTKSELIERIAQKQSQLAYRDVELAVKTILEHMAERLANGDRIEIRGFGSFSLHFRPGRVGRNPKTGAPVSLPAKHVPHFKPGKELRERVDSGMRNELTAPVPLAAGGVRE